LERIGRLEQMFLEKLDMLPLFVRSKITPPTAILVGCLFLFWIVVVRAKTEEVTKERLLDGGIYVLDLGYPKGIIGQNISLVTCVAVVGNEVHVAQKNPAYPDFFLVLDKAEGNLLRTYGAHTMVAPHGCQSSPFGLFVTDILGGAVNVYNASTGEVLTRVGSEGNKVNPPQFSAPADIALTPPGDAWISDGDGGSNMRILILDHVDHWQSAKRAIGGPGANPGQFASPHSIVYASEFAHIWVADRDNARLQVFNGDSGELIGIWETSPCFPINATTGASPWGVRVDNTRRLLFLSDGLNGLLFITSINQGTGWSSVSIGNCSAPLQTIQVPNGLTCKPHEMAVDESSPTGDVYLVGVGIPPTVLRYRQQQGKWLQG